MFGLVLSWLVFCETAAYVLNILVEIYWNYLDNRFKHLATPMFGQNFHFCERERSATLWGLKWNLKPNIGLVVQTIFCFLLLVSLIPRLHFNGFNHSWFLGFQVIFPTSVYMKYGQSLPTRRRSLVVNTQQRSSCWIRSTSCFGPCKTSENTAIYKNLSGKVNKDTSRSLTTGISIVNFWSFSMNVCLALVCTWLWF